MKKLLYLKDEDLKQYIEKIFLGYRETVSDARNVLNKYSIGVAHNKVIHLISLCIIYCVLFIIYLYNLSSIIYNLSLIIYRLSFISAVR